MPTTVTTPTTPTTETTTTEPLVKLPPVGSPAGPSTSVTGVIAPVPAGAISGKTVAIDPGHNGGNSSNSAAINRLVEAGGFMKACDTTGTSTNDGYSEAAYNWDVANRLKSLLEAQGVKVVMTRDSDDGVGPCISERAAIGNFAGADVALSIHADGSGAGNRGFHIIRPGSLPGLTDGIVAESDRFASLLREEIPATGMPPSNYIGSDGMDRRTDLGGLNLSKVPKVFVESGNMRDATDASLLSDPSFRQDLAERFDAAITRFLSGG
ncbi:MAG: N-acetylmuramoyl-L-alanine amidase [Microthrixaceae bacterium]